MERNNISPGFSVKQSQDEQMVIATIQRVGGSNAVNALTLSYCCPTVDVYAILQSLALSGGGQLVLETLGFEGEHP